MELGLILTFMTLFVCARDTELEEFVEKDIKIFFSSYPTYVLGLEEGNGVLVSHSKYVNPSKYKFITRARLVKSGERHVVIFGENNICKDGNSAVKCKEERPWDIDRKEFGYTISTDGMCLTKGPNESIEMKRCVNTDDQVFGFKLADLGGCGSVESLVGGRRPKGATTNVNIFQPDSEHLSAIRIAEKGDVKESIIVRTPEESEEQDTPHSSHEGGIGHHAHVLEKLHRPVYRVEMGSENCNTASRDPESVQSPSVIHLLGNRHPHFGARPHRHLRHHYRPHHHGGRDSF